MLSETSMAILQRHVDMKGRAAVCMELSISSATLSQVLGGKYGASTDAIESKIVNIYGHSGKVSCPVLGEIEPGTCASHHARALRKNAAGNPQTIRLHIACRICKLRG